MGKRLIADPCPWCGCRPVVEPWHGGGKHKHLVSCNGVDCAVRPMVSGPTRPAAIRRWNTSVYPRPLEGSGGGQGIKAPKWMEAEGCIALATNAMMRIALCPVIMGQALEIRAWAEREAKANPLTLLQSAHQKCVEWRYRWEEQPAEAGPSDYPTDPSE